MNKASGGSGIPAKLSKILKDDAVKVPRIYTHTHTNTPMSASLENSAVVARLEKISFHSKSQKGQCQRMFKLSYNYAHFIC